MGLLGTLLLTFSLPLQAKGWVEKSNAHVHILKGSVMTDFVASQSQ
jgi:hypothetical protein